MNLPYSIMFLKSWAFLVMQATWWDFKTYET